jgi:acetylornithine deacetylase/succinyl-diaminopimelate desuccinylase-like protein
MDKADEWAAIGKDAAATLSRYLQFDTTNPPGNEMAAAQWLETQLVERGITDQVTLYEPTPGRAMLLGRIAGSEPPVVSDVEPLKPLVLNHHIDVVPADPTQWSHAPFGGDVTEGYVWGRGALDTKGLGIIYLLALEKLIRAGVTFRRPIIFLAVPDEEMGGSQGMRWLVENHLDELDPEWVWDEGGAGFKGLLGDQPMFGVAVAEKQVQTLRLIATGEAGHGSMPHDDNANVTLMRALDRILKPLPMRINEVTATMFREIAKSQRFPMSFLLRHMDNPLILKLAGRRLAADKLMNAMLRDTLSLTMLEAGYKINVIPERAEAGIDCRLLPDTDAEQFHRWLERTVADDQVQIDVRESSALTTLSPIEGPFFDAVRYAITRHVPDAIIFPLQMPGASDSRFFRAQNIPAYGFGPFVLEMSEIPRIHGVDERISIENMVLGVKIACDLVQSLCAA